MVIVLFCLLTFQQGILCLEQEDPYCPAVYYARALTYAKSGLSRHENAVNALNDLNAALAYVKSKTEILAILERRAEVSIQAY